MEYIRKKATSYGKLYHKLFLRNEEYFSTTHNIAHLKNSYISKMKKLNILKMLKISWRLCAFGSLVYTFQRYIVCVWTLEGTSNVPTFGEGDIILVRIYFYPNSIKPFP